MTSKKDPQYQQPFYPYDLQSSLPTQNAGPLLNLLQWSTQVQQQTQNIQSFPPTFPPPQPQTQNPSQPVLSTRQLHAEMLPSRRPYENSALPQISLDGLPPTRQLQPIPTNPDHLQNGHGPNPSPSGVSRNGEKTRMRVNKACDRCRSHKIKCTGIFPCANCTRHGMDCKFRSKLTTEEPQAKKQKVSPPPMTSMDLYDDNYQSQALPILGRDTLDKADPGYTQYLENRIHYLESLLLENLTSTFKNIGKVNPDVQDVNDLLKALLSKWRFCRRHQNALVIELCKSLYDGLTPEAKAQCQLPRTQYFGWNMSGCNYLKPEPLPPLPVTNNLTQIAKDHYVDYFFTEVNPLYAILHEAVFREQIDAFKKLAETEPVNQTNSTALFLAMLCLVYALSIRFTEFLKPTGPSMEMLHLEESLFKYSHRVVLIFSFEWESFELIQCWLLVTLYLRISHRQTSANFAMGHAVNMCRSMGLGKTNQVIAEVTPYENLKAKRIFYAVYCFDRVIGLQGGRYRALNEFDITREFPSLDFERECKGDDWITLPAFAMMHIARIANFIHTSTSDNYDLIKAQQINKELHLLGHWFNRNGFDDANDIFPYDGDSGNTSSLIKAQVKLHYYDLLIAVHGKLLFGYFGKRIATEGMKIEKVLEANEGIVYLLKKIHEANLLFAPWYVNLLLLFSVGINCLVFINAGVFLVESRRLMKDSMNLLQHLQSSPVKNDQGKLIFRERFKMVSECIWAFKTANHIMALSFEESIRTIKELGIDHGPADVNKQYFTQFGLQDSKDKGKLDQLMEDQNKREFNGSTKPRIAQPEPLDTSPESCTSQPNSSAYGVEELLGNLQWFDQWLDFNHDL